eukprot:scaffold127488_cov44-Attheya_sp.AAC.7
MQLEQLRSSSSLSMQKGNKRKNYEETGAYLKQPKIVISLRPVFDPAVESNLGGKTCDQGVSKGRHA